MAEWSLMFRKSAEKDITALDADIRKRIIKRLDLFIENFELAVPMPLAAEFRGFYKLRIGDWRVIYSIDRPRKTIIVAYIDHRSKVYKL